MTHEQAQKSPVNEYVYFKSSLKNCVTLNKLSLVFRWASHVVFNNMMGNAQRVNDYWWVCA